MLKARVRLAWFSPIHPSRSGIAAYSDEILPLLRARNDAIDVFVDDAPLAGDPLSQSWCQSPTATPARCQAPTRHDAQVYNAHDFVWMHRRHPYDLTVFQLGNASCHDYMWAYLFNYPGLVVLHDAQLHQARALQLTKARARKKDYLAEFHANHPDAPGEVGDLVVAGLGESLYQHWPLTRLVLETARLGVVHNRRLRDELAEQYPAAVLDAIQMGVAANDSRPLRLTRAQVLARHGIPADAVVVAAFGGITPEKRIAPLIRALRAAAAKRPDLHLMLVGNAVAHFDVMAEAARWRAGDRVHVAGYVDAEELPSYVAAADICACLRWPTNRETSASWLRCLSAGRATIITELTQLIDVPAIDPHSWQPRVGSRGEPATVSVDIVDEDHSLHLALDRLAGSVERRARLGWAARAWWETHHQLLAMARDYERVIARAMTLPARRLRLPEHLAPDWAATARTIASAIGDNSLNRLLPPYRATTVAHELPPHD